MAQWSIAVESRQWIIWKTQNNYMIYPPIGIHYTAILRNFGLRFFLFLYSTHFRFDSTFWLDSDSTLKLYFGSWWHRRHTENSGWTGYTLDKILMYSEDRVKWKQFVHDVARPRNEDGWRQDKTIADGRSVWWVGAYCHVLWLQKLTFSFERWYASDYRP